MLSWNKVIEISRILVLINYQTCWSEHIHGRQAKKQKMYWKQSRTTVMHVNGLVKNLFDLEKWYLQEISLQLRTTFQ